MNWDERYTKEAGVGQDLLNAWGVAATGTGAFLHVNRAINVVRNNNTLNRWYGGGECSCCGKNTDALSTSMLRTHPTTGQKVCKDCTGHMHFNTSTGEPVHAGDSEGSEDSGSSEE